MKNKIPTHALITYTQHMAAIQREVYQLEIQTVSKPRTKLIQYIATTRDQIKMQVFSQYCVSMCNIKSETHKQSAFDSPWQKKKTTNNNKKQNLQM